MEESFNIEIVHKGKELVLPARFIKYGYSYRIIVEISGSQVIFEPDEERNFRARLEPTESHPQSTADIELVRQVGELLGEQLK